MKILRYCKHDFLLSCCEKLYTFKFDSTWLTDILKWHYKEYNLILAKRKVHLIVEFNFSNTSSICDPKKKKKKKHNWWNNRSTQNC